MGLFLALALGGVVVQGANKPITMREELITMEEFGAKLQAASGVNIEIPRPYRERKLDIFVDDLPLDRVLKGVGDALRGYWQKTDTGYRFEIETQQRNLEERLRQAEEGRIAEDVEAFFLAADALKEIGLDAFNIQTAIEWRNKKTRGMDPAAPGAQKFFKAFEILNRSAFPGLSSLPGLVVASQMTNAERRQLMEGEAFYVSSNATNLASNPKTATFFQKQFGEGTFLATMYVEPGSGSGTLSLMRTPNADKLGIPLSMQSSSLFYGRNMVSSNPDGLEGTPYGDALKKWETEEEIKKTLDFKLKNVPNISRGPYQNGYFRAADTLKFLNLYAGLDCIAEGTRRTAGAHPLRPTTSTAYETLTRAYDPTFAHIHWEKTDSGAGLVVIRDAHHWRNVQEPPEKLLRWAESRVVDGKLSKEDWGTLAANLSASEFSRLGQLALKLPSSPDMNKWLALRLYGSLTPEQRAQPSVSLASLSPTQRSWALSAFLRCLMNGFSDNGIQQAVVDGEFAGSGAGKLSIYMVRTEVWTQKTPYNAYEDQNVSPKFPDDYEKKPIEELRLGTSAKNSVGIGI